MEKYCNANWLSKWHAWNRRCKWTVQECVNEMIMYPDSKVHGANMGSTWDRRAHVGPMWATWTLLSGIDFLKFSSCHRLRCIYNRNTTSQQQIMHFSNFLNMNLYYYHSNTVRYRYNTATLQWRHNARDGVSNHWRIHSLLNGLFRQIKENMKAPRHRPLWGESTGDQWIPSQMFPFGDVITKFLQNAEKYTVRARYFVYCNFVWFMYWPCLVIPPNHIYIYILTEYCNKQIEQRIALGGYPYT